MDITLLSEDNRLVWLKFFADTVEKLNSECTLLRGQLDEYQNRAASDIEFQAKEEFVKKVVPAIKGGMFQIFLRLIFPSTVEVTSSRDRRALVSFGLTEKCDFATLVFDTIFKSVEGTSSKPVYISENLSPPFTSISSSVTGYAFDTPEMREQLWFQFGVGTFAVKTFNSNFLSPWSLSFIPHGSSGGGLHSFCHYY
jgi:hypothetical protein